MTKDRLMRLPEVTQSTGLSRRTIYRLISRGEFPAQVQISANMVAWYQGQIEAWIANPLGWKIAA